ncbi:hypothetical protein [Zunongwangia sp.]|uniref:hypothetical protein n=1 Tax=Zunongwangia sp. TaxID=1965325 RepID=UPI003AA822B8
MPYDIYSFLFGFNMEINFCPEGTQISRHSTKAERHYYFMDWSFKESQITHPDSYRDGIK